MVPMDERVQARRLVTLFLVAVSLGLASAGLLGAHRAVFPRLVGALLVPIGFALAGLYGVLVQVAPGSYAHLVSGAAARRRGVHWLTLYVANAALLGGTAFLPPGLAELTQMVGVLLVIGGTLTFLAEAP